MDPTAPTCELCCGTAFTEHFLPDGTTRTGLWVCRGCRLVFAPPPAPAPSRVAPTPAAPDWRTWGRTAG